MMIGSLIGIGAGLRSPRICFDNFNRVNNPSALGNAITGQAWVVTASTWGINNNQAFCADTAGVSNALVDAGVPNFGVSAKVIYSTNEGLVFRYSDAQNLLAVRFNGTGLAIFKIVANTTTVLNSYAFTPVAGTSYLTKVVCIGSTIYVYLDGVLRITVTEPFNQNATKVGLRVNASTAGKFDDFLVER